MIMMMIFYDIISNLVQFVMEIVIIHNSYERKKKKTSSICNLLLFSFFFRIYPNMCISRWYDSIMPHQCLPFWQLSTSFCVLFLLLFASTVAISINSIIKQIMHTRNMNFFYYDYNYGMRNARKTLIISNLIGNHRFVLGSFLFIYLFTFFLDLKMRHMRMNLQLLWYFTYIQ